MKERTWLHLFRRIRIIGPLCLAGLLFALLILSATPIQATMDQAVTPSDSVTIEDQSLLPSADEIEAMKRIMANENHNRMLHQKQQLAEFDANHLRISAQSGLTNTESNTEAGRIKMNSSAAWLSSTRDFSTSVAWGDVDGDNDLDLAVGNGVIYSASCRCTVGGQNKLYLNDNGTLSEEASWVSDESDDTSSVAWADVDGDGDLDLAVGNRQIRQLSNQCQYAGAQNKVYLNQGGALETTASWVSTEADFTTSIAWGDVNGDGRYDLVVGNGTPDQELNESCKIDVKNRIYLNTGTGLEPTASWSTTEQDETNSVAWGDWEGDGDLDLAVGNAGINRLYRNDGDGNFALVSPNPLTEVYTTTQILWVDLDLDQDLDLVTANLETVAQYYINDGSGTFDVAQDWGEESESTLSIAFGDADSDGDLDAASGHNLLTAVYHNKNGKPLHIWSLAVRDQSNSVAWADIDHDGDLDLAVGSGTRTSGQQNKLYDNRTVPLRRETFSTESDSTTSIAWGDFDLDRDLDLAVGNIKDNEGSSGRNKIYLNDRGRLSATSAWQSDDEEQTYDLAWGDVDGDQDLDLAVGNGAIFDEGCDCYIGGKNKIYINENGTLSTQPTWHSDEASNTRSIAWGDVDGDGDLDLAVGNEPLLDWSCECFIDGENQLYLNEGGVLQKSASWVSDEKDFTYSLAWADIDADGDLDLAVGNDGNNRLYLNHRGSLTLNWSSIESDSTTSIAWGDVDGDGDPDLMTGNYLTPNRLYTNNEGQLSVSWSDETSLSTTSVAWGDADDDGDLDLVVGNAEEIIKVYANYNGSLYSVEDDTTDLFDTEGVQDVAWADMDSDADLDLALGLFRANQLFRNELSSHRLHGSDAPSIMIQPEFAPANFYATARIYANETIRIPYRLTEADQIDTVTGYFSLDGGGNWIEAEGTINYTGGEGGGGPDAYMYEWDVSQSNFFGQSDNVVFRLQATLKEASPVNNVPGPFSLSTITSISYPFRVRGNQIQVFSGTRPVENALVYRLASTESEGSEAVLLSTNSEQALTTDHNGYLSGRSTLQIEDKLLAMYPISATDTYTLYYLSASPTDTGLTFDTIEQGGTQKLKVSSKNPLLIFDLDVSLEWDARNDTVFYSQLETAIKQASTILYDVSNGQVAIGKVNVYQAKENWTSSNVVIYANNGIRPSANIGGVVLTNTHDIGVTGVISDAYTPGQIRMGPNWDPFGENNSDLSQEWRQALAHELAHYLLFMPDNYIGISDQGNLVGLDCQGSFMTNTYDDEYSEFLIRNQWTGDCLQTIAQRTTGRTDWETINTFYPMINYSTENVGPSVLPLNITQINLMPIGSVSPSSASSTLGAQNYDIRNEDTGALQPLVGAKAYLFKTQNTIDDLTDDVVMPLGTTGANGDRLKVRGADIGDRLCVLGADNEWVGCEVLTQHTASVGMTEHSNWPPIIEATPITSRTLMVQAVLPAAVDSLNVQVLPAHGNLLTPTISSSVWDTMTPVDTSNRITFTQVITMDYGAFEGLVRVWVPNSEPVQEAVSQFYLNTEVWGGNFRVAGGNFRVAGGNFRVAGGNTRGWGAPMSSAEGQLTVFNVDNPYGDTGISAFQTLNSVPNLPTWFTIVGHGYRVTLDEDFTESIRRTLSFDYLQSDVPDGMEHTLKIYYSPDEGSTWQRMSTDVDLHDNRATTTMASEGGGGLYALISTVDVPLRFTGWNLFAYPVQTTRTISNALQSIDGYYSTLYGYDGNNSANPWLVYDTNADSWVNTLQQLEYGQGYWIYVTEPITLSLPVDTTATSTSRRTNRLISPPATYYGVVNDEQAQASMPVTAWINGTECGQGETRLVNGTLMYSITVWEAGQKAGCGTIGDIITFKVGSQTMTTSVRWDNSQVWNIAISSAPMVIYMPLIMY